VATDCGAGSKSATDGDTWQSAVSPRDGLGASAIHLSRHLRNQRLSRLRLESYERRVTGDGKREIRGRNTA